jgi:hypothetical protein
MPELLVSVEPVALWSELEELDVPEVPEVPEELDVPELLEVLVLLCACVEGET